MRILYPIIDGEVTGGNIICLQFIKEAQERGWDVFVNSPAKGDFIDMITDKCARVYHIDTTRSFRLDRSVELMKIIIAGIRSREEGGRKVMLSEIDAG